MKKWILALLVMMTTLLGSAVTVLAYTEGYFSYEVEDQSVIITDYFGDAAEVTIPASIAGNPVNTIAAGAFADSSVKKINLPDTIMTIETGALGEGIQVVYNSNLSEEEQEKYAPSDETDRDTEQDSGSENDSTNGGTNEEQEKDSDTQNILAGDIDENTVQLEEDEDLESQADTDIISPEEEPSESADSLEEVQTDAQENHNSVIIILIVAAAVLAIGCIGLSLWLKKRRTP